MTLETCHDKSQLNYKDINDSRATTIPMQVDDRYLKVDREISLRTKSLQRDEMTNAPRLVPGPLIRQHFTPIEINKQEPR